MIFWAGTAVGADELTLLRELQDVCVKRVMPESAQDSSDSRSCCDKSCLVLCQWMFHSLIEAGSFTDFFVCLLLLCYFILFLDSFKLVTAAT